MAQERAGIHVEGMEELNKILDTMTDHMGKAMRDATLTAAMLVKSEAQRLISRRSMGQRVTRYPKGRKPKQHVASRPYDAPNTDTGNLIRNIYAEPLEGGKNGAKVGTLVRYARALEFGYAPRNLRPRPFLRPAFRNKRKEILSMYTRTVRGAIKRYDRRR